MGHRLLPSDTLWRRDHHSWQLILADVSPITAAVIDSIAEYLHDSRLSNFMRICRYYARNIVEFHTLNPRMN